MFDRLARALELENDKSGTKGQRVVKDLYAYLSNLFFFFRKEEKEKRSQASAKPKPIIAQSKAKAFDHSVVIDRRTGLMWQKGEHSKMKWQIAVDYCSKLSLAVYNDWRLPDRNELETAYKIKSQFPSVVSSGYWSSTTLPGNTSLAWAVRFGYGGAQFDDKGNPNNVRCVRGRR